MNLLALRIGRHNNYWSYLGNFFNPFGLAINNYGFFDAKYSFPSPERLLPPSQSRPAPLTVPPSSLDLLRKHHPIGSSTFGHPLIILDNCLFNFDSYYSFPSFSTFGSATRSFFYYSNCYGLFFILPIFSPIKYSNSPWSGFLGKYLKSFFLSRITFCKSFILPHNDIDYLLNTFIFRFLKKKKSFASTASLVSNEVMMRAPKPKLGTRRPTTASSSRNFVGLSDFISGLKIVCHGRLNPRTSYRPGSIAPVLNSADPELRSAAMNNNISLSNSSRKKSFEVQFGYIPNNSSTPGYRERLITLSVNTARNYSNLGQSNGPVNNSTNFASAKDIFPLSTKPVSRAVPITYRFKPFYTQKGSNSFHLYISYKNFL